MKHTLQLEINARECLNENFGKAAFAIDWLCETLQTAQIMRHKYISMYIKSHPDSDENDNFVKYQLKQIEDIDKVVQTIKAI